MSNFPSAVPGAAMLDDAPGSPRPAAGDRATRKYIRASGLLLGGRGVSILLNLALQVLTVRYLAKSDYGAFAFGLGVASVGSSVVLVGLGKTIPRFIPIYQERGDYARVFGTMLLAVATVAGLGMLTVLLLFGLRGVVAGSLVTDPLSLSLLLILIVLVPLNALDHLLQNLVAIFAKARAIFLRRHVLGPLLKLAALLVVVAVAGGVHLLAYGYIIGAALGIWLYIAILMRVWREQGLLDRIRLSRLKLPAGEIFRFSFPLMSSELPVLLRGSLAVILLEYFHSASAVAEYRAVYPIAALNLIVSQAFGFLFVPLAARMFARTDQAGIDHLYWHTSLLILVLSFPVFAVTFSLGTPLSVLLFGAEYRNAGLLMTVLALGYYLNAVLGFSADTLRVYGRVRYAVVSDVLAALAFLLLCLLLIPRYNALGAAISATTSTILHNLCNHAGLWLGGTGIRLMEWRFVRALLLAGLLSVGLVVIQWLTSPGIYIGAVLVALASLALIRLTRRLLEVEETFPELLRIPLLRQLLA